MKLVYIGDQPSRFTFGQSYRVTNITTFFTEILDKDGVAMQIDNDILHLHFRQLEHWREEQIDKLICPDQ